jgi:hypothetical protein
MVRTYRAKIRAYTLASPEELLGLLQSGGFVVEAHSLFSETPVVAGNRATAEAVGVITRRL